MGVRIDADIVGGTGTAADGFADEVAGFGYAFPAHEPGFGERSRDFAQCHHNTADLHNFIKVHIRLIVSPYASSTSPILSVCGRLAAWRRNRRLA